MERIFTIGHSTRTLENFIDILQESEIKALADVRLFPGSRKYPHFNSDFLQSALEQVDISYMHFPDLGGRRKAKAESKNVFWQNEAFRGYADYMETEQFQKSISKLAELAAEKKVAVMCAEAVWWRCHRRLIADLFVLKGWEVRHIMDKGKFQLHKASEAAKYSQGGLFYT